MGIGHGGTGGIAESVTYWDQAKMILEVMSVLAIRSAFVLGSSSHPLTSPSELKRGKGTSQGGFVAARMALLDPAAVLGLILCGTSLLSETSAHGSWDIDALLAGALPVLESENPTPDFILPQPFTDDVIRTGFGKEATDEQRTLWRSVHEKVYVGDEGRRRYLMIIMLVPPPPFAHTNKPRCLRNRDTLTPAQLASLTCPILICHGTADVVYSVPLMQSWAAELKGAKEVKIQVVQEGTHFLSATSPDLINSLTLEFLTRSESKL